MPISHQVCGHSHIHLPTTTERSFGCGKHLGENRHKQAIPAAMSRESTDRTRNETSTTLQPGAAASRPAAIFRESHHGSV